MKFHNCFKAKYVKTFVLLTKIFVYTHSVNFISQLYQIFVVSVHGVFNGLEKVTPSCLLCSKPAYGWIKSEEIVKVSGR